MKIAKRVVAEWAGRVVVTISACAFLLSIAYGIYETVDSGKERADHAEQNLADTRSSSASRIDKLNSEINSKADEIADLNLELGKLQAACSKGTP